MRYNSSDPSVTDTRASVSKQYNLAAISFGREGKRRSGVADVMRHGLEWFIKAINNPALL